MTTFFWSFVALIIFHHIFYPLILKLWAGFKKPQASNSLPLELPTIAMVIPAFQEQKYIEMKLLDCLALDYPRDKLQIVLACDGCSDLTVPRAQALISSPQFANLNVKIHDFQFNRGKVAVLNEVISQIKCDILALSDVSAKITKDAFLKAAAHFQNPNMGLVCGTYALEAQTTAGEALYWQYQMQIKKAEAAIAAPMGAHGALYFVRYALWQPLELDTINDDFIMPMRIVAQGFKAVYDTSIIASEVEPTSMSQDYRRRIRIAAGNVQQSIRLIALGSLKRPALAFVFLGGKFSRSLMPFALLFAFWSNFLISFDNVFYGTLFAMQAFAYGVVLLAALFAEKVSFKPLNAVVYILKGHFAGLIGAISYFTGFERAQWVANRLDEVDDGQFIEPSVLRFKRLGDIIGGFIIFVVLLIVYIPIAILIKLDSKGPVFFHQMRVGLSTRSQTKMFFLTKFRSMSVDAEKTSGAVWASKQDPRVTKIGGFLRKTRLDELPQCINVLRGEMSLVGPRPERPAFFVKLEDDIPFFSERVSYLKPGITGLAQVEAGYPTTIEETRMKVMFDHAYAMRISKFWSWFKTDSQIIIQTIGVVVRKQGH